MADDQAMTNAMNYVMGSRQAANAGVIGALDEDPDKAAESINLGKATGVDPVLINTDIDYFKRQNKVRATSALIDSNEYIREFMLRNPMAPKVAHDDVGNLDNLTMNVAKEYLPALANPLYANFKIGNKLWQLATGSPPPWQRGYVSTMLEQNPELVGQFLKGASYGTPELIRQPMLAGSKALIDFSKLSPEEYKMQQKSLWEVGGPFDAITWFLEQAGSAVGSAIMPAAAGGIGMVAGIPGGPGGMAAGGFLGATSMSYIMNYGEVHKALEQAGVDEATAQKFATMAAAPMAALDVTGLGFVANRFMSAAAKKQAIDTIIAKAKVWGKEVGLAGAVEGGTEGIQEVIKDAFVSAGSDTAFMTKEHAKGWVESALAGFAGGTVFGSASAVVGTHQKARPYIDAGKDPPAGLDPTLDQIKGGQATQDMKRIDGLLQDAKATNLRDRSPEMVSDLLRRQVGDTVIEIPSNKIFDLYKQGETPVTPDDGLLGWVTDLEQQMRAAYPQGGFVSVPLRDWLAHVTDDVHEVLHDHILPRPSGLTIDEAKTQVTTKIVEPVPTYDLILSQEQQRGQELATRLEQIKAPEEAEQIRVEIAQRQQVATEPASAQIIGRSGQVIAGTRQAASLGTMTQLGPNAEWMLYQNRLQMQAIMDKLSRAKTPEEFAAARQEVKEVEQLLRTLGKEATGRLTEGGWDIVPGGRPVTIAIGDNEMDVIPTGTSSIKGVLGGIDFSYLGPTSKYLQPIIDRVNELASDIPVYVVSDRDFAELEKAAGVEDTAGVFTTYEGRDKEEGKTDHIIIPESSFHSPHAAKYVFHEAIHAATSRALYDTPALVSVIDDLIASLKESNPELVEAYGFKNAHEFVAEAISNKEFQDALASIKMTEGWAKALGMKEWQEKSLWQGIVEFIRSALSVPKESFTVLEGALRLAEFATEVQAGVLARQEGVGRSLAVKKQLELPGITRQEDLAIFEEARTVGLTIDQYIKMMENIAQRNTADTAFLMKQVEKFVRKRLTQEWKQEELKKKIDVADQMNSRPDIALMNFFRTGRIYGEQVGMPKIDGSQLTPEQRKLIPDRWLGARGMAPMDAAQLVGYTSVDQMALRVALLNEQMIAAKQPSLRKYVDGLVKVEVERQMVKEFGGLEENILKEVQEHVVSPTQMDLLHEDTVAMGMANGWTMPFTKAEVIAGVKAGFGKLNAMKVSMEKFLRDSGRAGKLSGIAAEIDKNSTEFFKQRQKQEYSMRYAGEAKKLEKELTSFDNTAGKLSRREARTIDQTYFNYAQDMLEKAGLPVKNSRAEIDRSIAFKGHANMDAFITHEKGKGVDLDLYIPENYEPKKFEDMTVDEFREFKEVVDTLEMAGRIRRKIHLEGEQRDADAYEAEVLDHVTQMPLRPETPRGKWMYRLDAVWTRMEEIVKDLDLREELGPLWRGLIHPFELSKSKKFSMIEDLAKKMKTLMGGDKAWQKTLADEIPQDFVYDTRNGVFFKLTRWNLIKMMLNVGNESNKAKLARGIASAYVGRVANGQETEIVMNRIDALIDKHANKEDWQFVQNIWDIFQGFAEEADTVIRNTMGKVPKWIEATPISNKHGDFAGGYIPLIKDKLRLIEGQVERPDVDVDALMGPDFYRAATSRPHHLERTGAVYFVDITNGIENLAGRMQQHIHDIAFRDFVLNAGKIIYNKKIMSAIEKHYGIEYANQMEPWLKRIANEFTVPEKELGVINDLLRFVRLNLTAAALPLNYSVMYSPSVGTMNIRQLLALGAETQAERKRILGNSEELKHVLYTIDRDLTEQLQHVVGGRGAWAKWTSFQRRAVETMYKPLVAMEQETRAVTFYGEFMAQKANGLSDGEAASLADSVVRERHGAVSAGDLPAMMASNSEFVKVATVFMGYFSMVRNWTRQLPGQYRRGEYAEMAKTVWGTMLIATLFNVALFTRRKEDDTIWSFFARALLDTPMSMIPYVREGWGHFTEGRRPTSPLFGMYMATQNLIKDGVQAWQGKEVKHPIRHPLTFLGLAAGVPGTVQLGRTGEGLVDVVRGKQRPRDFNEWMRLLHTGEAKLKK